MGSRHVRWFKAPDGREVEVVGCFDNETPEGTYDFYDLFHAGVCINEGEPCYDYPSDEDICAFLELQDVLK